MSWLLVVMDGNKMTPNVWLAPISITYKQEAAILTMKTAFWEYFSQCFISWNDSSITKTASSRCVCKCVCRILYQEMSRRLVPPNPHDRCHYVLRFQSPANAQRGGRATSHERPRYDDFHPQPPHCRINQWCRNERSFQICLGLLMYFLSTFETHRATNCEPQKCQGYIPRSGSSA